jgi:hypothetical protein
VDHVPDVLAYRSGYHSQARAVAGGRVAVNVGTAGVCRGEGEGEVCGGDATAMYVFPPKVEGEDWSERIRVDSIRM